MFTIQQIEQFKTAKPFNYLVIDDFFPDDMAIKLSEEFPDFENSLWHLYNNAIEYKKTCNIWNFFPSNTYQAFSDLCSESFVGELENLTESKLYPDTGLHGGGWHIHSKGGKLNVHLDYNLHPKLTGKQRKLNLIVYMTPDWDSSWGGGLELWSHCDVTNSPKELVTTIENRFNRAVIFDTTQNSWHGLPCSLNCPENIYRKSIATYYLQDADTNAVNRQRALFAPYKDQINDSNVLDLIQQRSDSQNYAKSYVK